MDDTLTELGFKESNISSIARNVNYIPLVEEELMNNEGSISINCRISE
jgi:hypothetical protein